MSEDAASRQERRAKMPATKRWFGADEKVEARKVAKTRGELLYVRKGCTKDKPKPHVLAYYVGSDAPKVPGANTIELA